jgi:hypothetical protein
MSNAIPPATAVAILDEFITGKTFRVVCLGAGYTYSSAHEFADDLTDELGTPQSLTGVTILSTAWFDADDVTYPGVNPGDTINYVVIYDWTSGVPGTSRVVAFMDTNDDTTLIDRDGDGGNTYIKWPTGGIFN